MAQDGKKMVFDRIQLTENYFGELCTELSSFTKKKARLRDKYDELARIFKGYADTARFNDTLFNGLLNYSKSCTHLADVKDMEVQRLQAKTLRDLASYEHVCKNAREALKHALLARGKEHLKNRSQQRNSQTEKELNPQIIEETNRNQDFETNFMKFERKKITDIRQTLLDFTLIQLKESVQSVEILSSMYRDIAGIDVDKDLEEFEEKFLNKDSNNLKSSNRSQSMSALATQNSKPLKRTNMSNSTMNLSSPNKDLISNLKNGKEQTSDSETEDETTKTTEQSSGSEEEEESRGSSQTKPSSYFEEEDDDDEAVQVHPIRNLAKKIPESGRRAAPVPQVRFSKLVGNMKH